MEKKKKKRKNRCRRQMSLGIQPPSFYCSCSLWQLQFTHSHTQTCVHTLTQVTVRWGGAVTMHISMQTPQLVTHWKVAKTPPHPPPPTHTHHQTESCPPLIRPLSRSLDLHYYRCAGHSFLFVCWGGGGSSYIFLSSLPSLIPCNSANKMSLCLAE